MPSLSPQTNSFPNPSDICELFLWSLTDRDWNYAGPLRHGNLSVNHLRSWLVESTTAEWCLHKTDSKELGQLQFLVSVGVSHHLLLCIKGQLWSSSIPTLPNYKLLSRSNDLSVLFTFLMPCVWDGTQSLFKSALQLSYNLHSPTPSPNCTYTRLPGYSNSHSTLEPILGQGESSCALRTAKKLGAALEHKYL